MQSKVHGYLAILGCCALLAHGAAASGTQWQQSDRQLNQLVKDGYEIKGAWPDKTPIRLMKDGQVVGPYEGRVIYTLVQKESSVFQCRDISVMDGEQLVTTLIYCLELVDVLDR